MTENEDRIEVPCAIDPSDFASAETGSLGSIWLEIGMSGVYRHNVKLSPESARRLGEWLLSRAEEQEG